MIRRNSYLVLAAMIGMAAQGNAGTATVTPALAACSKALVETLARSEPLPSLHRQGAAHDHVDQRRPELVHGAGAQRQDQGAAGQGLVPGDTVRRDRLVQVDSGEELTKS